MTWLAVLVACAACLALKLGGLLVPAWLSEGRRRERVSGLLPVALLAALVAVQVLGGHAGRLVVDARIAGLAAAALAVTLRAPFLAVVALAAATTALVRVLA